MRFITMSLLFTSVLTGGVVGVGVAANPNSAISSEKPNLLARKPEFWRSSSNQMSQVLSQESLRNHAGVGATPTRTKTNPNSAAIQVTATTSDVSLEDRIQSYPIQKSPSRPNLSIPAIDLINEELMSASVQNIPEVDAQLLKGPVLENQMAGDVCKGASNSYLMGHSEPAEASTAHLPATRVFERLHELKVGDRLYLQNSEGDSCVYQVFEWQKIQTDQNQRVSADVFANLFQPNTQGESWLTVQTCQKGSATVRLILRAKLVQA